MNARPVARKARLAWGLWALYAALMVILVGLVVLTGEYSDLVLMVGLTALPTVGVIVASHRPENAIGWLLLAIGLTWAVNGLTSAYAEYALVTRPGTVGAGVAAALVATWSQIPTLGLLSFVLLLFPTGHLPSARWRPVAWLVGLALALATILKAFGPVRRRPGRGPCL